jgi:outer membrane immunogenic protein
MTHRSLFAAAAILTLAAALPAMAQETDESPWHGWYAGINLGGEWGDSSHHFSATSGGVTVLPPADVSTINGFVASGKSNNAGFVGGIEGGYNYRTGNLLLGVETDFDSVNLDQSRAATFQSGLLIMPPIQFTIAQKLTTDWLWTVRPRIGYTTGSWLFYGTIGLAVGDAELKTSYSDTAGNAFSHSTNPTRVGYEGGVGIAYAFTKNWSIKGEWLYEDLGTVHDTAVASDGSTLTSSGNVRANIVRMGIDYRF